MPGHPRTEPFSAFMHAYASVVRRLDDDLRREHALSLQEYSALLHIAQAPDGRLRMTRLSEALLLSKSGVTRLIDRLEAHGLVARHACPSDARGAEAAITPAGLARLQGAGPTHLRGIEDYFLSAIPEDDLATVERVLERAAGVATRGAAPEAEPR